MNTTPIYYSPEGEKAVMAYYDGLVPDAGHAVLDTREPALRFLADTG
jgi:hypothetical protein